MDSSTTLATHPTATHLFIDQPAAGAWNMAADEILMRTAAATGHRFLRFYGWSQPTLSLGYFQPLDARRLHLASRGCPLVRRATGGGAIVHHQELTYSFAAPVRDRWAADVERLYDQFHRSLARCLSGWNVTVELVQQPRRDSVPPFLCFLRRARGDVLLNGHKVAGSAQRRQHGAVLQHGSILLGRSPCAPELPGISELSGQAITAGKLIERWCRLLSSESGWELRPASWTEDQLAEIGGMEASRYGAAGWTERR